MDLPTFYAKEPSTHPTPLDIPAPIVEQVDMGGQFESYTTLSNGEKVDDDEQDERNRAVGTLSRTTQATPPSSTILMEDNATLRRNYPSRRKFLVVDDSSMNR